MPRKNNSKTVTAAKQKKLLESRLMQINIVIDECVYQNQKISATEAEAYIEEVASYKTQRTDARSLQVIDKITRCMKAIIEEQQEQTCADITDTQNVDTYCPSPVYSLPDEDRMMFSQDCTNDNIVGTSFDKVYTIDLCDEEDDANAHSNMQVEVEIHRAMSSLSINENATQISEPYSQSILENFEAQAVGVLKNNTCLNINQTESRNTPILKLNSKKTHPNVFTNTKPITPQKLVIKNVQFKDDDIIFVEPKAPPIAKRKRRTEKLKDEMKKGTRQKKTFNKNTKSNVSNKGKKRNSESKKKVPTIENIQSTPRKLNERSNAVDKNHMKMNANQINANTNSSRTPANIICPTKHKNYSKSTEKIHTIYNKNVENDLSWIENIRYVREVAEEEVDLKFSKMEDTFWNNLMFPSDWNDRDFNY